MNTKDLKSFEAVYEEQSINQAAKKLYITPQGLSKNIKTLENELDTVLFERTRKGVKPTESAHLLHGRAESMIRQFDMLEAGIRQLNRPKATLRIGCACGVFNVLPFRLLQTFIEEHAPVCVEWSEYPNEEVKELLAASRLEYGLIVGPWEKPGITGRKLAGRDILLLVYEGHPFYESDRVGIEQLKGEAVILMNEHFHMFHDFVRACQVRGFYPDIAAKTADSNFLYKLCKQGFGLGIVPGFILEDFKLEHVKAIPFEEKLFWEVYGVFSMEHQQDEVIRTFDKFLAEYGTDTGSVQDGEHRG